MEYNILSINFYNFHSVLAYRLRHHLFHLEVVLQRVVVTVSLQSLVFQGSQWMQIKMSG